MSCTGSTDCLCGCCAGTGVQTPHPAKNTPGQNSISYRTGTWATFKESMLSRLSSFEYPALSQLKTREDDDFTIALLDATSVVLDILTFYQERLANENYLGTATQLRSLTELARLIGYQPSPGVSSTVYLAFTLKAAPGQPADPSAPAITIPKGTQAQSVPAQGQKPQVFETSLDIQAKADWNALPVLTTRSWLPQTGDTSIYLQGTASQISPGDLILIVGDERLQSANSNNWDVRVVTTVRTDTLNNRTYIAWSEGLGSSSTSPAQQHAKFYAFRQRAALFGYNAVNPLMLSSDTIKALTDASLITGTPPDWRFKLPNGTPSTAVDLVGAAPSTTAAGSGAPSITVQPGNQTVTAGQTATFSVTAGTAPLSYQWQKNGTAINGATSSTYTTPATTSSDDGAQFTVVVANSVGSITSNVAMLTVLTPAVIDLDAVYTKVVPKGWIVLIDPDTGVQRALAGHVSLYQAESVTTITRSAYAISSKISRVRVDTDANLSQYYVATRTMSALVQSEELPVAQQPLDYPLYGGVVDLQGVRPDLLGSTVVALSGKRQKIVVADGATSLTFVPDDPLASSMPLKPGDILTLTDPGPLPLNPDSSTQDWSLTTTVNLSLNLNVEDAHGRPGTISNASLGDFTLVPSSSSDPEVSECALVKSVSNPTATGKTFPHTRLLLRSNLINCYDRNSTTVNANVALASNGQSVSEIMGNGSASTPNQEFTLKQSPLTYVQAPTPTGRQSTLQVRVNGASWTEVSSLYQQSPSAQVFATLNESDGTSDVLFGDGIEGATLPTGQNNIQAHYRIGLGSSGNVAAGAISTLIDRPLGVSGVTNPQDATGGGDPDSIEDVRTNAPQSVLTLARAVSITDYQSYASTFAGIAKAHAIWIASGPGRGVFLTVAGAKGAALPPGNPTLTNLTTSLQNYGNPMIPITAMSFLETLFGLSANLAYDPAYDQPAVQAAVLQALTDSYSFANRTFGQGISADEVSAIIQAVPGVVAVNVTGILPGPTSAGGDLASEGTFSLSTFTNWLSQQVKNLQRPNSGSPLRICPFVPVASSKGMPLPAEILVLDPNPNNIVLGTMS